MAKQFRVSDWESLGGKARKYRNIKTGEEISRWAYNKLKTGVDFRTAAEHARIINPEVAVLRPARGRKSALKKTGVERKMIAEARIEDRQRREEIAKQQAEVRKLERKIDRARNKKVKRRKITKAALIPGRRAVRTPFNTYGEYLEIFAEAKRIGVVAFMGVGVVGLDENTGEERDATIFTMRLLTRPIPEDEFEDEVTNFLEAKAYFAFSHYFAHVAYRADYADAKSLRRKK